MFIVILNYPSSSPLSSSLLVSTSSYLDTLGFAFALHNIMCDLNSVFIFSTWYLLASQAVIELFIDAICHMYLQTLFLWVESGRLCFVLSVLPSFRECKTSVYNLCFTYEQTWVSIYLWANPDRHSCCFISFMQLTECKTVLCKPGLAFVICLSSYNIFIILSSL
jgi:hypothetical protein